MLSDQTEVFCAWLLGINSAQLPGVNLQMFFYSFSLKEPSPSQFYRIPTHFFFFLILVKKKIEYSFLADDGEQILYLFGRLLTKRSVSSVGGTFLWGEKRVIENASLLRGKQMHRVCPGAVSKKQSQEPGRIIMVFSLQMCGDKWWLKKRPHIPELLVSMSRSR